jgi:hypothetical protein
MLRKRQLPPSFLKRRKEERENEEDDELGLSKFRKMELTEEIVEPESESEPESEPESVEADESEQEFDVDDFIYELEKQANEDQVDSDDFGESEESEREEFLSDELVQDSDEEDTKALSPIETEILGSPMTIEPSEEPTDVLIDQRLQGSPMEYNYLIDELETLPPTPETVKLDAKLLKDLFGESEPEQSEAESEAEQGEIKEPEQGESESEEPEQSESESEEMELEIEQSEIEESEQREIKESEQREIKEPEQSESESEEMELEIEQGEIKESEQSEIKESEQGESEPEQGEAEQGEAEPEAEELELHDVGIMTSPRLEEDAMQYRVIMDYINAEDEKLRKDNEKFIQTQQMGGNRTNTTLDNMDTYSFLPSRSTTPSQAEALRALEALRQKEVCNLVGQEIPYKNTSLYVSEKLGVGSFGCVYMVVEPNTIESYILKQIKKDDPELMAAQILKSKFRGQEYPDYLMEYIDQFEYKDSSFLLIRPFLEENSSESAHSLYDYFGIGNFTKQAAFTIFSNIVNAVNSLHEKGIVHNDLKPNNILCRLNGDIQIIDFGTLCTQDIDCTISRTPAYVDDNIFKKYVRTQDNKTFVNYQPYSDLAGLNVIFFELISSIKPVMFSDIEQAKTKLETLLEIKIDKMFMRTENTIIDNWMFMSSTNNSEIPYDINADVKRNMLLTFNRDIEKTNSIEHIDLVMTFLFLRMYFNPVSILNIINTMKAKIE